MQGGLRVVGKKRRPVRAVTDHAELHVQLVGVGNRVCLLGKYNMVPFMVVCVLPGHVATADRDGRVPSMVRSETTIRRALSKAPSRSTLAAASRCLHQLASEWLQNTAQGRSPQVLGLAPARATAHRVAGLQQVRRLVFAGVSAAAHTGLSSSHTSHLPSRYCRPCPTAGSWGSTWTTTRTRKTSRTSAKTWWA